MSPLAEWRIHARYPCGMTVSVWVGNTDVSPAFATPFTVCVKYQLTVNVCSPGVSG